MHYSVVAEHTVSKTTCCQELLLIAAYKEHWLASAPKYQSTAAQSQMISQDTVILLSPCESNATMCLVTKPCQVIIHQLHGY